MDERCQNCVYVQNLEKELTELKEQVSDIDKRLIQVEKKDSARDEQIKTIFTTLKEIKEGINRIADKIEKIETKPGATWEKVKLVIITAMCTGMVSFILSKILK